jgi:hypothetical protein
MKADVELSIIFQGNQWIAGNGSITAAGGTLVELDQNIKRALAESGQFTKGSTVTIYMKFDFSSIPDWIRQYSPHYFNRMIKVEI